MSKETLRLAGEPLEYFRTQRFCDRLRETEQLLLELIDAPKGGRVFFLTASGSGAMDAAVSNLIKPTDRVLVVEAGTFSRRWAEICRFYGLTVCDYQVPFARNMSLSDLENTIQSFRPDVVLMTRNETSSMQLFDVRGVGELKRKYGFLFVVDAISSFAIDEFHMADSNVSAVVLCTNKGLALSTGMSMIVLDEPRQFFPRSYYLDLRRYDLQASDMSLPFTPNLIALKQLYYKLLEIKKLGMPAVIEKVAAQAAHFRNLATALGFELLTQTPSNCGTLLRTHRTDVKALFCHLQEKGIFFTPYAVWTPSGGEAGTFIVGHIGDLTSDDNVVLCEEFRKWLSGTLPIAVA
jgi:aspartate aminotransferase-like enzyme